MGSWRSELARVLFGLDPVEQGEILLRGAPLGRGPRGRIGHGLAFVTENRREEGLLMEASIADNLGLVSIRDFGRGPVGALDREALLARAEDTRGDLSIKAGDIARQPVKALSGGNQQKVVLGKWLMTEPHLFILDEPTRGVDVGAKFEIYTLIDRIAASGSGILLISSEIAELTAMADRIVVMSRGEVTGSLPRARFDREHILRMAFREIAA
jgi:ribose transport system ATP-binding protein